MKTPQEQYLAAVDKAFSFLEEKSGHDFRKAIERDMGEFEPFRYFMNISGRNWLSVIEEHCNDFSDSDFLDDLDYNAFALEKSLETKDASIMIATLADCLKDIFDAMEKRK